MAKVQSFPAGYIALLGIKDGQNPFQSADFITPVVSLDTFYLAAAIDSASTATAGATNNGDFASVDVPAGEAWRLLALSGNVLNATAPLANVRIGLQVLDPRNFSSTCIHRFEAPIAAVTDTLHDGIPFPQPIVVPPGTRLRAQLLCDLGAATIELQCRVLFQRLTV